MTVGIIGFGAYVPRLRLNRQAVAEANAWFAPHFLGKVSGSRAMANWDEDSVTMAVAAARDCMRGIGAVGPVCNLLLASSTLPFVERLNSGIAAEALRLGDRVAAADITGSQTAALSGLAQALASARGGAGDTLLLAVDARKALAGSTQEMDYGDGAAALRVGATDVLAECVSHSSLTVDFVDHFRGAGREIDYQWEERWVRDEGIAKLVPKVIKDALTVGGVQAAEVDYFIFPSTYAKVDAQLAKLCGLRSECVVDTLSANVGDVGVAHALLMLCGVLERALPGQTSLLTQFGSGAQAFLFRVTSRIAAFRPRIGVSGWLARGVPENRYTRFLVYKNQLPVERGMRGEQDRKTALSTYERHRDALAGFVGGRCRITGDVHFPPSRISYTPGAPAHDSQDPYPMADLEGRVLSWSAEYLSFHLSPPHQYGQVDFDGGGRVLMDFTDVSLGDISPGTRVEMVFRIKDVDEMRGFKRYFWKATPVGPPSIARN